MTKESAVVDCSKATYSYSEMVDDLKALADQYPSRFTYRSFGKSLAGRDLYVATLGDPNAPKQILISAGIHGREYLTPLLAMKQLEFYLHFYDVGECNGTPYAQLFDDVCICVVPMTNPDGVMLSQEGLSSVNDLTLRETVRKVYEADLKKGYTSQTDVDRYLKYWKANVRGVDLNRNFDALWEEYDSGEKSPCHRSYKGAYAASEPETQAMMALTDSLSNLLAVVAIHSQGEVLYWNCGQDDALLDRTEDFTRVLSASTGYTVVAERNNDASYTDWCALERGLIAVTVETGLGTCPLPISQFSTIWLENYDLVVQSISYFE